MMIRSGIGARHHLPKKQKSGSLRQREREAKGALVHCSLCQGLFEPANWRQCVRARVIFCKTCRETKKSACAKIARAARKQKGKKAQMAGNSDRRIARLIAEAQGSVKVLYDRFKGGEIPPNLRHYQDDPNTY